MSKLPLFLCSLNFLLSPNLLSAQLPCDTDAADKIVSRARETILGEGYSMAPEELLPALPLLEKCPNTDAKKAAICEQAAKWQTALERFDLAAENLKIYSFNDTAVCLLVRPDTSLLLMSSFNSRVRGQLITFLEGLRHYPESSKLPEAAFVQKERAFTDAAAQLFNSLISPLVPWLTGEIISATAMA